jgi:hypothetical protein
MKKFLFLTLSLMLVATGAWAIKGKVDTKVSTDVAKVEKSKDAIKGMPIKNKLARFADAPEDAVTLPYLNTLNTADEYGQLSVYDANGDNNTWGLYALDDAQTEIAAGYKYSTSNAADDYLIFPPMLLDATASYSFSIDAWARLSSFPERFEVLLVQYVTDENAEPAVYQVIESTDVANNTAEAFTNNAVVVEETDYYSIYVHAISDADQYYLYVDNMSMKLNVDKEMAIALVAPASVIAGQTIDVTATVTNGGGQPAQDFTVIIKNGEEELVNETVAEELAPGAKKEYAFEIPTTIFDAGKEMTFTAEVVYEGDEVPDDNSATATTAILGSGKPAPINLVAVGNADGTIVANWEVAPAAFTEEFEQDTDDNTNTDLPSGWTTIDNDGDGYMWYHLTGANFNNHSGVGHVTSASYQGAALTPDNWLVTPKAILDGTFSFWAAGQDASYAAEVFAVYVSTTDATSIDNFVKISEDLTATGEMTEYTFDLSSYEGVEGYIAIRHYNITDMFRLNVDDITYIPVETPEAFNIYLDGELVETVSGDVFTYTFEGVEPGDYTVQVTAVYGDLESEPAEAEATVPGEVVEDKFAINITQTGEGVITCPEEAAPGETVTFTIDAGENTYELSITDGNGEPIDYQPLRTGVDTYSFVMPDGPVNINVTFSEAPFTGVNDVNAGKTIANVRYYNMAGQRVAQANGATIVVTTYTDGTTRTVKMMK